MTWTEYQDLTAKQRAIAWAAATDAGNRSMRQAGRKAWNEIDWNVASRQLAYLEDRDVQKT